MNFSTVPPWRSRTARIASNQRPMIARSDSGSSRSPRWVEPVTSANTTVTTLRTSRLGSGAVRAPPHAMQNRATSGFGVPQLVQADIARSVGGSARSDSGFDAESSKPSLDATDRRESLFGFESLERTIDQASIRRSPAQDGNLD